YDDAATHDRPTAIAVDNLGNVSVSVESWAREFALSLFSVVSYNPDGERLHISRYNGLQRVYEDDDDYEELPFEPAVLTTDSSGNLYVALANCGYDRTVKYNAFGHEEWV